MELPEDPTARLDMLVRTLSRMTAPYGYTVRFGWDGRSQAFLGQPLFPRTPARPAPDPEAPFPK